MTDPVSEAKAALDRVLAEAQAEADAAGIGVTVSLGRGSVAAAPDPAVPAGEVSWVWMDKALSEAIEDS